MITTQMSLKTILKAVFLTSILLSSSYSIAQEALPDFKGWVNDTANVLSIQDRSKIESVINELEAKTSAEIAVVTVLTLGPYSESGYAQLLFDKWKVGKKGKDNGVIILLAVKERRWRIQTGYGVEGVLTDAACSE
ncbi:MAG: TPM domain-containing protein, partial [Candidatus Omnitrophica bacterium]|nr:TPM domain-containing protein [Candidatus Omnitrophota bacterium]